MKWLSLLIALFFFSTLNAQNNLQEDDTTVHTIEEVLVLIKIRKIIPPLAETVLDKQSLQSFYFGQELPVVLQKTPGVTWYSDGGHYGGYSYMRLRGIDATRINFSLNGVPLNEPEDQGIYFSNFPDFVSNVSRVDIQRGVGISTTGTAAFGGAVDLTGPNLLDSAYTEISGAVGSYNTFRFSSAFNSGLLQKKWAFNGRYSRLSTDGFREHSGTDGQTFFLSGGYFHQRHQLTLTGFSGESANQMAYLAVPDSVLNLNYRYNPLGENETDGFRQTMVMLQYLFKIKSNHQLTTSVYYNHLIGGYRIFFAPDMYRYAVTGTYSGAIIQHLFFRGPWRFHAGINTSYYTRAHKASIVPSEQTELYRNIGVKSDISPFVKGVYSTTRFLFAAEAQYRYVYFGYKPNETSGVASTTVNWGFLNAKAGITYHFENGAAYVSLGQIHREPTRNDLFAGYDDLDSLNASEILPLNRVKPEQVTDLELGYRYEKNRIRLAFGVYAMQFRNEIAAIGQLSYIGLPLRKNVDESFRRGFEWEMDLKPTANWVIQFSGNWNYNRIKSYTNDFDSTTYQNVQPYLTPSLQFYSATAYTFLKALKLEVGGRFSGKAYLDNTSNEQQIVPSSFIVHSGLVYSFGKRKESAISFLVNNLLNQRWYASGYVQNAQSYYYAMAKRNFMLTVQFRF